MNNFKSQGQTFEEARVTLDEGIFIEDPFFKDHLNNLRKQRAEGFEIDMEKARTVMVDMDQFLAARPDINFSGDDPAIAKVVEEVRELVRKHDLKVVTSPTGRRIPARLVMEWQMPGGKMRPIDKNTEFTLQLEGDFAKLEEMCLQDVPKPKHPLMFKITDLVEDPEEFKRLRARLERSDEVYQFMGVRKHPIFVEAIPDANILVRTADETMRELMKLCREFNVDVYFGTKQALKPVMWAWMYGARKKDLDLSEVEEISVEKAKEFLDKQRKVAIVGGTGIGASLAAALTGFRKEELAVIGHSFDTWNLNELAAIAKVEKPARDWEHTKLRRGKGHNKFKRKGKK